LELFGHVGDPALAEALPGERVDATSAKHGPHSEFEGAGVGGRHDRAEIVGGQPEQRLGLVDGKLKARLALLRPVRAAEERLAEVIGRPAGALGARAGGEMRAIRPLLRPRGRRHVSLPFQIEAPRWGGVSHAGKYASSHCASISARSQAARLGFLDKLPTGANLSVMSIKRAKLQRMPLIAHS